ncbi:TonB-dependent receptor [Sphingomonas yantingensis]|uniref:TonB-dependent receptor n=1 Tax=Sphingomonas yantingensis TaxID=1241761 RepID=A0A7W9EHQ2_9SPHN|nr:TonB-dependent receptor [Sphingomonas yantingensis]MBB5698367.1 hypothetical protein [Sphingomonas yantingensis]
MSRIARALLHSGSALPLTGAAIVAAAAIAAPAHAQDYQNVTASGRIISTDGKPVAGATVTIRSNEQGFSRTATTNASGAYRIPQVPTGPYTFTITADGFDTFTDESVVLSTDAAGNQFALAPAGTGGNRGNTTAEAGEDGEIVVTAGRVKVADFERTTTGAVIDIGDLATRVPVQRSLRDVILLAPGTTQGSSSQNTRFANQAQIGGSSFSENAYYINGLNVTEFRQGFSPSNVPFDFYQTIEVKTGGFQAEFGRATGGVVNAITKSGGNEFSGSVLFNWEPDALRSNAPNTYEADNDGDRSERLDMVATLSGPIIKDKLFFFALYNNRKVTSFDGSANSGTGTFQSTDDPFYAFKVDAVPFDGQRLEFTYFNSTSTTTSRFYEYNPDDNTFGAYLDESRNRTGGENYVGRYTGTFTDWFTLSAAYGVNKNQNTTIPADTTRPFVQDTRSGTPIFLAGSNPVSSLTTNEDKREFYRVDADLYFSLLGSHHIRFGYDQENLTSTQISTPTGDGSYELFTSTGANDISNLAAGTQYAQRRYFENGGVFKTKNEAFYIQDNWTLFNDRVNLQLGIRNDRFLNRTADGLPFYESGDQWGPRLGVSFDVFGDKRTKLYANFGRYFLPIPTNTNIRLAGAELDYSSYFILNGINDGVPVLGAPVNGVDNAVACPDGTGNNCTLIADGTAADPSTVVAQNLKPQSLDEYIIGAEQRLGDRWRVGINYTHRKLNRSLEDSAIDLAVRDLCAAEGIAGCENIWIGFHQYVLLNPGEDAQILLDTPLPGETERRTVTLTADQLGYPAARRTYDAVTFEFEREYDGVWSLQGSYTWANLKGNLEGGVKSDIGQTDSGLTQDFDSPGLTVGSYGFLPGHRRHTFKLFGSYTISDAFTIGANAFIQSPRKFGCIGVVPDTVDPVAALYGAAGNFCNGQQVDRGTAFQSDWRKEINLTAQVRVPVDGVDASVRFDVFNVFNSKSALEFDEFGEAGNGSPNPNYRAPLGYQTPRSARIQLRVGF